MKKIYNKVSLKSRLINFLFRFTSSKKIYSSEENIKKYLEEYQKVKANYNVPNKLGMTKEKLVDYEIYSYNGTINNNKGKILLYVHGGSFAEEAIDYQIKFAMKIADKTNSTLIFPRYKLIPEGNYKDLYKLMDELYAMVSKNCDTINFLGDSSGGGFVLSYSMYLRDNNLKKPQNILMLSPWVDLTMENEELKQSNKLDRRCSIEGNKYCGKLWASNKNIKDYLISPIYGTFNNLPKITIATGGYDILKPDCEKLSIILEDLGINHNYIEFKRQGHDFGCFPTKEGNELIEWFSQIINCQE